MKLIKYINYFLQVINVLVLIFLGLTLTVFKDFVGEKEDFIFALLIALLLIGIYQLIFSILSLLAKGARSFFNYHLLGSALFFLVFGILVWLVDAGVIDYSVMEYFDRNEVYSGVAFFAIPICLFIYFCFITFIKLSPFNNENNEDI